MQVKTFSFSKKGTLLWTNCLKHLNAIMRIFKIMFYNAWIWLLNKNINIWNFIFNKSVISPIKLHNWFLLKSRGRMGPSHFSWIRIVKALTTFKKWNNWTSSKLCSFQHLAEWLEIKICRINCFRLYYRRTW